MSKKTHLKNRLKNVRKEKHLTQGELADLAGISRMTVSSIETQRFVPSAGIAAEICYALGCKFEDVFYFDD